MRTTEEIIEHIEATKAFLANWKQRCIQYRTMEDYYSVVREKRIEIDALAWAADIDIPIGYLTDPETILPVK